MPLFQRRFRFMKRVVNVYGRVLLLIGVLVSVALHWRIDKTRSPGDVRRIRIENFYSKSAADRKISRYMPLENEVEIEKEIEVRLQAAADKKIILFWAPATILEKEIIEPERDRCGNCEFAYNRSLIDDPMTGAVIYHFNTVDLEDMPRPRNPHQLHIFLSMESPATMLYVNSYTLKMEESFVMNATMGYRIDSDFLLNYETMLANEHMLGNDDSIFKEILKPKRKLAIAIISDCSYTPGARVRMALIQNLIEYGLRIDTFGECFKNRIDNEELQLILPQYKFYFSYENSYHCKDYITEKFFGNALAHGIVPVVWGATKEDYEAISPPGCFILAEDFKSPKHLIEYIEMLDSNDEEYLQFFRWRTMKPQSFPYLKRTKNFCAVCRALHGINADDRFNPRYYNSTKSFFSDGITTRIIPSIRRYLYEDERPECFNKWDQL